MLLDTTEMQIKSLHWVCASPSQNGYPLRKQATNHFDGGVGRGIKLLYIFGKNIIFMALVEINKDSISKT